MKTRLLLSALTFALAGSATFVACNSTQPKSACIIQTTPRGGPGFWAKYTVLNTVGNCAFLGKHHEGGPTGPIVTGEELGVAIYGTGKDLSMAIRPFALSSVGVIDGGALAAFGSYDSDPALHSRKSRARGRGHPGSQHGRHGLPDRALARRRLA